MFGLSAAPIRWQSDREPVLSVVADRMRELASALASAARSSW